MDEETNRYVQAAIDAANAAADELKKPPQLVPAQRRAIVRKWIEVSEEWRKEQERKQ